MSKTMTVTQTVTGGGKVWLAGQPVTSPAALKAIDDKFLVPMDDSDPDVEQSVADGQEWYDGSTIKTVLDGVGEDLERAQYAYDREVDGDERAGVLGPLSSLLSAGEDEE